MYWKLKEEIRRKWNKNKYKQILFPCSVIRVSLLKIWANQKYFNNFFLKRKFHQKKKKNFFCYIRRDSTISICLLLISNRGNNRLKYFYDLRTILRCALYIFLSLVGIINACTFAIPPNPRFAIHSIKLVRLVAICLLLSLLP